MDISQYIIIPAISIRPDKIVSYKSFFRREAPAQVEAPAAQKQVEIPASQVSLFDFALPGAQSFKPDAPGYTAPAQAARVRPDNKHGFELSRNAQKNLREKISWLYHYAKNQTIKTHNGKILAGFKMNFVTLKLPSQQQHTSDFITKNCLNQLFIEIAKKYSFRNYVWRLEYQKNGNLHYHIATDTYIDFYWLRGAWNRILNKYHYVDVYKDKFSAMSLQQYCRAADLGGQTDFATLQRRYADGQRNGWRQPNSVDVKCVTNHKAIAFYIAKYMGKSSDPNNRVKLPVCEDNSAHGRLWFCSRSLSKLKAITDFHECFSFDVLSLLSREPSVKKVVHDYCVSFYYTWRDLTTAAKRALSTLFRDYGQVTGYTTI